MRPFSSLSHKLRILYRDTMHALKSANCSVSSKYISDVATRTVVSGNFTVKAAVKPVSPLSAQLK